jgi:hypothetical protein
VHTQWNALIIVLNGYDYAVNFYITAKCSWCGRSCSCDVVSETSKSFILQLRLLTKTCTLLLVDWDMKLQQTMVEMFPLNSADAAYTKISGMLSTLGDPFTRIISPKVVQQTFPFRKSQSYFLGQQKLYL